MGQLLFLFAVVICAVNGRTFNRNTETVDAMICHAQLHGAKIPHPTDCSKYFVCDRDFPELMHCSDGLLFDVNLNVCNWPRDTTCVYSAIPQKPDLPPYIPAIEATTQGQTETLGPDIPPNTEIFNPDQIGCKRDGVYYLPHPTQCDYYFICVSRTLHQNYCGLNMHWDYVKQRCDHPESSICYSNIAAASPPSLPSSPPESPETTTPSSSAQSSTTTSPTKAYPSTVVANLTTLSIDENSVATAEVTISDSSTADSSSADASSADASSADASTTDASTTDASTDHYSTVKNTSEEEDLKESSPGEAPPQNPLDGFNPDHVRCIHDGLYFLPHPTNCEMYFICINHTMHLHQCGVNIHWDYLGNKCTAPTAYRCYSLSNESPSSQEDNAVTIDPVANPLEGYDPEYVRCSHPGFYYLPHPSNCNLYFVCSNYSLNLHRCGLNSTWNFLNEECSNSMRRCYYESFLTTTTEEPITVTEVIVTETVPYVDPEELVDPMEGYDDENVSCLRGGFYFLPHPYDCALYFICVNRTLNLHRCGNNIFWNHPAQRCDLRKNTQCYNEISTTTSTTTTTTTTPVPTTTTTTTTTTPAPTTPAPTTTTPTTTTTTSTTAKPRPTVGVFMPFEVEGSDPSNGKDEILDVLPKCPRHQAFFPHTKDCHKYYICIGGVPIMTKCPDDLYWDAQERMCGLPSHTKCNVGRKG